jgi:SAM-dependent methyltransferase
MAMLAGTALFLIDRVLPHTVSDAKILSIGRMSMAWDIDNLVVALEQRGRTYSPEVADSLRARRSVYTTRDFFALLGFENYSDIDFDSSEGCTLVHDLNEPLPREHHAAYDLVVENGTLEHIFDIKTAIGSIAACVRKGGIVCHVSPLDAFNHGFYNFSVNFFHDFYAANGFGDLEFFGVRYCQRWQKNQNIIVEPLPYTHEEFYFDPEIYRSEFNKLALAFVATKKTHIAEARVPTQAAYDRDRDLSSRLNSW